MNNSDIAITVNNISKCYRIGLKDEIHEHFASAAFDFIKSPLKNYRKYRSLYDFSDADAQSSDSSDVFWALKDVSFEVKRGEVLGLIGKNGAGKSTLLKILCRIADPTGGRAEIRGRVSSLLEVGTGFHPELTGRENVYLNATILGMKRREVDRKFDEIVAFSGIEKFIDTPVKRYSSGMQVRLAFSVAAHLEPEILIIDEVLAVGDAEFQKKCMGRMEYDARQGRTLLLVSHNMSAITNLCERAIYLHDGQIKLDGPSAAVVSSYLSANIKYAGAWNNAAPISDENDVYIESATVFSAEDEAAAVVDFDRHFSLAVSYRLTRPMRNLCVFCRLTDSHGNILWTSWDTDRANGANGRREKGGFFSKCRVPEALTRPGLYYVSIGAMVPGVKLYAFHENVLAFDVSEVGYRLNASRVGLITPLLEWEVGRND